MEVGLSQGWRVGIVNVYHLCILYGQWPIQFVQYDSGVRGVLYCVLHQGTGAIKGKTPRMVEFG